MDSGSQPTLWDTTAEINQAIHLLPNPLVSSCDGWVLIISIISRSNKAMKKNTQQLSFVFQMRVFDSAGAAG